MNAFQSTSPDVLVDGDRHEPIFAERAGHWLVRDPEAALELDGLNARHTRFPGRNSSTLPWQRIRGIIAKGSRALHQSGSVVRLYDACLHRFDAMSDTGPADLTSAVMEVIANCALPLILDDAPANARLAADQNDKIRRQLNLRSGRPRRRDAIVSLYREYSAGRAASRALGRPRLPDEPARRDLSAHLLELQDEIGLKGLSYLVVSMSSAASTAPGAIAACLLYRLLKDKAKSAIVAGELKGWDLGMAGGSGEGFPATMRFIREAMRLHPFPPTTRRLAYADLPLGNSVIMKGDTFDLSADFFHRSDEIWRDPDDFDDSRWMNPTNAQLQHFFPFGFGRRACPGATIGMDQLLVFLRLATVEFRFALVAGAQPKMSDTVLHAPTGMIGTVARQ